MTFETLALDPSLMKAIKESGYTAPTPIQARAIPFILKGRDIMATAQTGTGKTAAFMLPALQHLLKVKTQQFPAKPRILILTPTRELANQITAAAQQYGKFQRLNICSVIGGISYRKQLQFLSRMIDIVVATPGRLIDFVQSKKLDLSAVEMLVLDEADRMLDMGFIDDVKRIIQLTPKKRQSLLFSATTDGQIETLAKSILNNPEQIRIAKEKNQPSLIEQRLYMAENHQHKSKLLKKLLENETIYKAIIFSATRSDTVRLARQLCDQGYTAIALNGGLKQAKRNAIIKDMRNDKLQFLVATDVASRGIDISDITHVINYDFPKFAEDYVHRIGRTGRAGKTGVAISLLLPKETQQLRKVEKYLGQTLKVVK